MMTVKATLQIHTFPSIILTKLSTGPKTTFVVIFVSQIPSKGPLRRWQ
jgi:hypothetical protein